ncbi:MAG TPA: RHS repeat-associated core domain-containing protein [Verrucomicrobiae bacterium]|nr:RHS repeat-associated core domain-containing protein [Verrucomicrobiae bacterium]
MARASQAKQSHYREGAVCRSIGNETADELSSVALTTYGQEIPGAPTSAFYHADANGNVIALIYPNQQLAAKYLYDPFGNMLAMSGPLRDFNKYRFSSKEWNDNSGLYYYGYRFYEPSLQRWPNHDPLGERGFQILRQHNAYRVLHFVAGIAERAEQPDLYEFVANNPVKFFDSLGLDPNSPECQALEAQLQFHSAVAAYDESFGNYQGWAEEAAICMELGQMMQEAGCFDPPPPPPETCPAPAPAPPSRGFNPPRGFWPIVGIGVGIGIGVAACVICPECCAVGVLAGA